MSARKAALHVEAEGLGGSDDSVVRTIGNRFQDGKPSPRGRTAVGVNADRGVGVGVVADCRPLRHAGSDTRVGSAGQHHGGTLGSQVGGEVSSDVEVEPGFGVTSVCLSTGGVACLVLSPVPDDLVDHLGRSGVPAVVAGVNSDDLPGQWPGRDRAVGGATVDGADARGTTGVVACARLGGVGVVTGTGSVAGLLGGRNGVAAEATGVRGDFVGASELQAVIAHAAATRSVAAIRVRQVGLSGDMGQTIWLEVAGDHGA